MLFTQGQQFRTKKTNLSLRFHSIILKTWKTYIEQHALGEVRELQIATSVKKHCINSPVT